MGKELIIISLLLGLVLFASGFVVTAVEEPPAVVDVVVGSSWETSCEGTICQTTFYSYEKYKRSEEGDWIEINEDWSDCSNEELTRFCTEHHSFNVSADETGLVTSFFEDSVFAVRLSGFRDLPLTFNPSIEGSVLTYEDIVPDYIDLRYQYLQHMLKEELVIKKPLPALPDADFDISFTTFGNVDAAFLPSIICDSNDYCEYIEHVVDEEEIRVRLPVSFLNNPDVVYPVYVDPTIAMNGSYVAWNGYISSDLLSYSRFNNPKLIVVGDDGSSKVARAAIDWNVSAIPDGVEIINASLDLSMTTTGLNTMNITHMEGNSFTYTNNPTGNQHFYADMANGSVYDSQLIFLSGGTNNQTFNLTSAADAIADSLSSDVFSMGIIVENTSRKVSISSSGYPVQNQRPALHIVYDLSSADIDSAIVAGIGNSTLGTGVPVYQDQQIYLVDSNGTHYLGRFDSATDKNNQTWAFSYVREGEPSILMPSLFNVLNVWENKSLTYQEIVDQVSDFIDETIL